MTKLPAIVGKSTIEFAKSKGYKHRFFVPKKTRMYLRETGLADVPVQDLIAVHSEFLRPSVTSVFGILDDPDWAKQWRRRVGEERADQVCNVAMRNGTQVHNFAENYFAGTNNIVDKNPKVETMIQGFLNWAAEEADKIRLIPDETASNPKKVMSEIKFRDNPYGYSGTADFPYDAYRNGEWIRTLADYKTSSQPKIDEDALHKYKMQTAAYIISFNHEMKKRGFDKSHYCKQGRIIVFTHSRKSGRGDCVWVEEEEIIPLWQEFMFYHGVFMQIFEQCKHQIEISIA